jgi:hypothetical protein
MNRSLPIIEFCISNHSYSLPSPGPWPYKRLALDSQPAITAMGMNLAAEKHAKATA